MMKGWGTHSCIVASVLLLGSGLNASDDDVQIELRVILTKYARATETNHLSDVVQFLEQNTTPDCTYNGIPRDSFLQKLRNQTVAVAVSRELFVINRMTKQAGTLPT